MKKLIVISLSTLLAGHLNAQTSAWVSASPLAGIGSCWNTKDYIIDARPNSPLSGRYNRIGILHRGTWGGHTGSGVDDVDKSSQYVALGPCDMGGSGVGPSSSRLYGYFSSMNTDRMFVGLRYRGIMNDSTGCVDSTAIDNAEDAVIAWGNDADTTAGWTAMDKLKFMFYGAQATGYSPSTQPLTIATMTPQGLMGIGTENPTAQLHTTGSVRFQGLTTGTVTNIVGIDANGNLFKTTGGGTSNSCGTVNIMPKTTSTAGALGCSQIFDNGTSVGINTTTGFGYTSLASSLTGPTLPPATGTIRLDVAGVTRSLAFIATSDERFKTNIKSIKDANTIIQQLNGKTYNWNAQVQKEKGGDAGIQYGFLAQEVQKIMPEAVIVDENGNYGINYNSFIPVLVESQKNLTALYETEKQNNENLKAQVEQMQLKLDALTNGSFSNISVGKTDNVVNVLYQNTPNPFSSETKIDYNLQSVKNNAFITVYNLNGEELNRYPINLGKGSVTINALTMKSGMYLYALIVDGREVDTKKMILTK